MFFIIFPKLSLYNYCNSLFNNRNNKIHLFYKKKHTRVKTNVNELISLNNNL